MNKLFAAPFWIVLIIAGAFISSCNPKRKETLEQRIDRITKSEMQSVAEFLGNDLLEGRAPGTRGGALAEIYMASLMKFMDLEPGADDSFYQPFVMKGFTTSDIKMHINGMALNYIDDMVGTFTAEEVSPELNGEAVLVGFGITTNLWDWDDYKDVDIENKIVITRVNDPGIFNPDIFEGTALTYFGRWTYHIEEAARRGAAGILLIHTDQTAGYDWNVVKNSWTGEELYIESDLQNKLKFRGWIKESSLQRALEAGDISLNALYEKSQSEAFIPLALPFGINISAKNSYRDVTNRNVIAEIPGQSQKRIVLSAHIDHLGMDPSKDGDNIYNGAIDNGTAVGAMMVVAKILKEFQADLHYTVTILGCNAEESGLLGSKYFVRNSDRGTIAANINFESTPVWGESKSIMGIGARFSGFEELIMDLAEQNDLGYSSFSLSNQGLFYRSDQFPFARYGIPAVWISAGEDEISGARSYTEFWGKDYHTVDDEYDPEWELGGMHQTIKFALLLIDHINSTQNVPEWKDNLPFPVEK